MPTPNKTFRIGPVAIGNAAANILNGAVTSLAGPVGITLSQPVIFIKHLRALNKTASPGTITAYIGATGGSAAGTESIWMGKTVPANDSIDAYFGGQGLRLDSADFLTALANAVTTIVVEGEAEVGFS